MSLAILCTCLVLMVKLLNSVLKGKIAIIIKKTLNSDLPGKLGYFTGYIAILVGAGMTILVQSSSVFTSAMTPLVGIGVIKLERMYPLTLGSNIGTTATGLLAAMAASGDKLESALQIALCHLFFNISGILIYYPIPIMRLPIKLAKVMGNTTAKYRWFAIFYLIVMFFLVPGVVFALSMAGLVPMTIIVGIAVLFFAIIIIINVIQRKWPSRLPKLLRNWEFLPECMHSLDSMDRVIRKLLTISKRHCFCCKTSSTKGDGATSNHTIDDPLPQGTTMQSPTRESSSSIPCSVTKGKRTADFCETESGYGSAAISTLPTPSPSRAVSRSPSPTCLNVTRL